MASPNPGGAFGTMLTGVSAVSANDVWAVGSFGALLKGARTLVLHWDGAAWTRVVTPNVSATDENRLLGVAALAADDVWAVGSFSPSSTTTSTLIMRWNGRHWFRPNSPSPGALGNELLSVSARASKDVWAVGDASSVPTQTTALVEHWNGRLWKTVPGPDLAGAPSSLLSVSAATKKDAWVVGYVDEGGIRQTLTAHWDGQT